LSDALTVKPADPGPVTLDTRVAVLEQIAKDTKDVLVEMKLDIREMRQEFKHDIREMRQEFTHEMREMRQEFTQEMKALRAEQKFDFRLTFGALITLAVGLAGLMAHGFHWL
jgi:DNA anti-recombination protein RmuC